MNRLSKIFLVIIIILTIALGIMTYSYFNMKKTAKNNLDAFFNAVEQVHQLEKEKSNTLN